MNDKILLGHGSGGQMSHDLIKGLFVKYFHNKFLSPQSDSSILPVQTEKIAFTTDSFVVDPIFFPGGDIGKLAIAGTVNDLAVSGAKPLYLSCSFIIEEGLPMETLEKIVRSMAGEAEKAGILITTGDTKVVDKGKCDKIFINTTGVGELEPEYKDISSGAGIQPGDRIILNGSIADHGMAIMAARNDLNIQSKILSDCACLNGLIAEAMAAGKNIRFMRDATRGGLGTVLSELAGGRKFGVQVEEDHIAVKENVRGICELLGFDPIYVANEGKVLMVAEKEDADKIVERMRKHPLGKETSVIGEITEDHPGKAWITTKIGGKRLIDMLAGEQLPRIC
ncbi:MAG: hydrogenase expression/formation protein HypE [Bacteroidota bacterium]|nr:hydrogenase expression/formation protein HypE [Bacteroidota bacterium]